jgi:hypothetical protein
MSVSMELVSLCVVVFFVFACFIKGTRESFLGRLQDTPGRT